MKVLWALFFLAVCAFLFVAFHVIRQEINIRRTREIILLNTEEIKTKEGEILISKDAMQKLSSQLEPLDKQSIQLTKTMEELLKKKETSLQNLNTCQKKKTDDQQQKSQKSSEVSELRTSQQVDIQKLQEEVQNLEKQILERDTKICLYVDKEREEGRTLCKDKVAASNA